MRSRRTCGVPSLWQSCGKGPVPGCGSGEVGALQEGVVTPGCPLPRCHCPCALCCSCPVGPPPPAPYHEVPFGTRPLPSPVRVNPHIPQALPAGNCYLSPNCQFGPVRTHVQHGLQQLWWLQTRPQMSPYWVGVAGNAKPSREQLCLHPCASSPGYPLSPHCWHRAGDCSLCPLPLFIPVPCQLELFVPLPCDPRRCGAAGLLEGLQEGSAVSFGSPRRNFHLWEMSQGPPPRHKHFPLP